MPSRKLKTGIKGRGGYLKGWSNQQPSYKQRGEMIYKCGKKCFLGPNKSFPICTKNTCKINRKGIYSAYIRAREYTSIFKKKNNHGQTRKYSNIASKAKRMT